MLKVYLHYIQHPSTQNTHDVDIKLSSIKYFSERFKFRQNRNSGKKTLTLQECKSIIYLDKSIIQLLSQ